MSLTCANTYAQQQTQNPIDAQILDSVIIQNQRIQIPFSKQNRNITIIAQNTIKTMPVNSVDELLSYVAGIDVKRRGVMGAQADISINGGTFDQTLVLLNGVKVIDPQTGHNIMNLPVSLNAIKRIEIIKGPAASAYGVNAINGAINIVTRQPRRTGITAHLTTGSSLAQDTATGDLYAGLNIGASASLTTENSRHFLALNTVQSNGYRYNTSLNNTKIFYSNHLDLAQHNSLKMMAGYVSSDFGANGFYAAPVDTESKETVQTAIAAVRGVFNLAEFWTFRPSVSYRYNFDQYILDRYHPEVYKNRHYTNVFDIQLNNSFYTGIGTFGFGVEWRKAKINSNSLGEHTRTNFGLFGNYSFDLLPRTLINLGVYANYNADFGWNIMPSIDLGYALSDDLRIYANAATGMRLPTYTDLYYSGPVNVGNPNLKPEKSWQTAIGLKYNTTRFRASAEYFYRHTDDFIDWIKDNLTDPWTTKNYQEVNIQGAALSTHYQIIPKIRQRDFSLAVNLTYTYLSPEVVENTSADKFSHYALANLKHQLTGNVSFGFLHRFNLSLGAKYQKRLSYKDYVLLATRLSVNLDNFQVFAEAKNITNVQYIEAGAVPLPGSWFSVGLKWNWWK